MSAERSSAATLAAFAAVLAALAGVALAAGTTAVASGGVAASPPNVETMIVGSNGSLLSSARTVVAGRTTVRAGHNACAVAAATPLAALAAARRGGGPGFALRDYGRCGSSAASSGELFVYSIGGETNSGQSGWEYKVDQRSGTTGAADPSGPMGNGVRLRSGDRVLWFWCHASGAGCQRTLTVSPAASKVSAFGSLTVKVTGYDNLGRGAPIAGAIVTLGTDFASTNARGRATLIAPAPGRYAVAATRPGLVPSFPETIVVR
jgi:hypothetical protein